VVRPAPYPSLEMVLTRWASGASLVQALSQDLPKRFVHWILLTNSKIQERVVEGSSIFN
jgi:hypothetical protein